MTTKQELPPAIGNTERLVGMCDKHSWLALVALADELENAADGETMRATLDRYVTKCAERDGCKR